MGRIESLAERGSLPVRRSTAWSAWLNRPGVLGYVFVGPILLLLLVLMAYPFGVAVYLSLSDRIVARSDTGNFVGLENFATLLRDSTFRRTIWNSLNYTFVSVVFKLGLGLLLALLLNEAIPAKRFFRGAFLLPWVVPTSLSILGWLWMFNSTYSVFNWVLTHLGGPRLNWLGEPFLAMLSLQIVNVWRGIPFFGIMLLAGLQSIPRELHEAASIDGANAWQRFWAVTWPLLAPVTMVVTLFSLIHTLADFQVIYVLTRGGPINSTHVFATYAHQLAIGGGKIGQGTAAALMMTPLLAAIIYLQLRELRRP
ncbi:MAG: carbohydrate ABC transporter permease [Chloroflexota bacterium]